MLRTLEQAKAAVLNSLTSASGQRTYDHAIREFVAWYCFERRCAFNRTVVLRYRIRLEQRQYAPGDDQRPVGGSPASAQRDIEHVLAPGAGWDLRHIVIGDLVEAP